MPFFVQYDEIGNINAVVSGETPPDCARQLTFADYQDIIGKKVVDGTLVDADP